MDVCCAAAVVVVLWRQRPENGCINAVHIANNDHDVFMQ